MLKCKILAQKGLYLPLLPYRCDGKLFFSLCRTCTEDRKDVDCNQSDEERCFTGTWVTDEVKKAVSLGYKVLDSIELWHYSETTQYDKVTGEGGIFAKYVNTFLKFKQESSGWPAHNMTDAEKDEYIRKYKDVEGVDLDKDKISI